MNKPTDVYKTLLCNGKLLVEAMNSNSPSTVIGKYILSEKDLADGRALVGCVRLACNFINHHSGELQQYKVR